MTISTRQLPVFDPEPSGGKLIATFEHADGKREVIVSHISAEEMERVMNPGIPDPGITFSFPRQNDGPVEAFIIPEIGWVPTVLDEMWFRLEDRETKEEDEFLP